MKYVFFSDIHANPEPLEQMLKDTKDENVFNYIFLGDVVGYFYWPHETFKLLMEIPNLIGVSGNHDQLLLNSLSNDRQLKELAGKYGSSYLESYTHQEIRFLKSFPDKRILHINEKKIGIFHGTPEDVLDGRYYPDAKEPLKKMSELDTVILGNTHYRLNKCQNQTLIINPGSLGLPRDGQGYSYLVYESDCDSWEHRTVCINIENLYYDVQKYIDYSENNNQYLLKRVGEYI